MGDPFLIQSPACKSPDDIISSQNFNVILAFRLISVSLAFKLPSSSMTDMEIMI